MRNRSTESRNLYEEQQISTLNRIFAIFRFSLYADPSDFDEHPFLLKKIICANNYYKMQLIKSYMGQIDILIKFLK